MTQGKITTGLAGLRHTAVEDAAGTVVFSFEEPLTAKAGTLVHRELARTYPGATIATSGDRTVTVTAAAPARRRARKSSPQ